MHFMKKIEAIFSTRIQLLLYVYSSADMFVLFCFVLFCFVLFCFVLFCFVLFCFVLFCFVLFCFVLFCFVLFCFVLKRSVAIVYPPIRLVLSHIFALFTDFRT